MGAWGFGPLQNDAVQEDIFSFERSRRPASWLSSYRKMVVGKVKRNKPEYALGFVNFLYYLSTKGKKKFGKYFHAASRKDAITLLKWLGKPEQLERVYGDKADQRKGFAVLKRMYRHFTLLKVPRKGLGK